MKLSKSIVLPILAAICLLSAATLAQSLLESYKKPSTPTNYGTQNTPTRPITQMTIQSPTPAPKSAEPNQSQTSSTDDCNKTIEQTKTTTGNATNDSDVKANCVQTTQSDDGSKSSQTSVNISSQTNQSASSGSVSEGGTSGSSSSKSTTNVNINL